MSEATVGAAAPARILLHGVSGSGKSTAARLIGERLGIEPTSADDLGWQPGWVQTDPQLQRAAIAEIAAREAWIIDSAYSGWRDILFPRVELVIGLDYSRWLSLGRLMRRTLRRIVTGEEICNGNRETLRRALARDSIIVWHFQTWKGKRRSMRAWAADPEMPPTLLFRHPRELERWIASL